MDEHGVNITGGHWFCVRHFLADFSRIAARGLKKQVESRWVTSWWLIVYRVGRLQVVDSSDFVTWVCLAPGTNRLVLDALAADLMGSGGDGQRLEDRQRGPGHDHRDEHSARAPGLVQVLGVA